MFFGQIVNISEAVHEFSFVRGRDCVIHLLTHFSLPFLQILSFFDLLAFPGRNLMIFCLVSQCFRIRSQMFICKRETELLKLFSLPFFHKCYHTLILTCEILLLLAFPGSNLVLFCLISQCFRILYSPLEAFSLSFFHEFFFPILW